MRREGGVLALAGWLALSLVAGALGGVGPASAKEFHARLQRPGWAPPSWLFRALATLLFVPYLGWVLVATALTWSLWRRNPTIL